MKKYWMLVAWVVSAMVAVPALAQLKFNEHLDYQAIEKTIDEQQAPKVIEFFWFGCPHCKEMHPRVQAWLTDGKPEAVSFELVPAMPSERWAMGGHLFYAAKALKLDIIDDVFEQVHEQRNLGIIFDADKAQAFLVEKGADEAAVKAAWASDAVKADVARGKQLFNDSGVSGVPAFIVNGRYEVPYRGDDARFFDVINFVSALKK